MISSNTNGSLARVRQTTRCLACIVLLALVAGPGLHAKKKDKADDAAPATQDATATPAVELSASGELDLETAFKWENGGTDAAVDWTAANGGPTFKLQADGSLDLRFAAAPWFRTGALFEALVAADTNAVSPAADEPYLVIDEAEIAVLAGWYAGAAWKEPGFSGSFRASLEGGLQVLDLSQSDADYQTGTGEDFWYRVMPRLGSTQTLSLDLAQTLDLSLGNRFLAWWDAETAYGRNWNLGYEDSLKLALSLQLAKDESADWDLLLNTKADWDTTLITPTVGFSAGLGTSLKLKDIGALKFSPVTYAYQADMPGFDAIQASAVLNQVGGKVSWESRLDHAAWSIGLEWPWTAWADTPATTAAGTWELSCAVSLLN